MSGGETEQRGGVNYSQNESLLIIPDFGVNHRNKRVVTALYETSFQGV
jgi:hypothetical protein